MAFPRPHSAESTSTSYSVSQTTPWRVVRLDNGLYQNTTLLVCPGLWREVWHGNRYIAQILEGALHITLPTFFRRMTSFKEHAHKLSFHPEIFIYRYSSAPRCSAPAKFTQQQQNHAMQLRALSNIIRNAKEAEDRKCNLLKNSILSVAVVHSRNTHLSSINS